MEIDTSSPSEMTVALFKRSVDTATNPQLYMDSLKCFYAIWETSYLSLSHLMETKKKVRQ